MDELEQLKQEVAELKEIIQNHQHTGVDGSSALTKTIQLDEQEYIKAGSMAMQGLTPLSDRLFEGAIVVGNDENIKDGSKNSQITIQHSIDSNNTFMFGLRSPLYTGDTGSVTSGGTTMSQTNYSWATNELAGAYVVVYSSATVFDVYNIASNTSTTITITGGTWSFTKSGANFLVFMPIYCGSAEYPWRRLYTMDGIGGGLRFGRGQTNAGQQDTILQYQSGSKIVFAYNDGGTVRYKYLDLAGTGVTWVHTTTAP